MEALTTIFDHEKYVDAYREALLNVVDEKAAEVVRPEESPLRTTLPDLMAALREAVEEAKKKQRREAHTGAKAR